MLNDGATVLLGPSQISWVKGGAATRGKGRKVEIPLFLDATRTEMIFSVTVAAGEADPGTVAQRALSLIAATD